MATLKKYNLSGALEGVVPVSDQFVEYEVGHQMIKDYIVALRANARQWSANTKTRSEVNHTTIKPYAQKGTGRARHGSFVAPQYRGGGRVFAPKPKFDQHVKINKKERRAVIRSIFGEKIDDEQLFILKSTAMECPKTNIISNFLACLELDGRVLFLGDAAVEEVTTGECSRKITVHTSKHANFVKSVRNMQGVSFRSASSVSGYDLLVAQHVIMTEEALREVEAWLCTAPAQEEEIASNE